MSQLSPFFERDYSCPVCQIPFKSLSIRSSSVYLVKKESDFHAIYKDISPLHYSVVVCPVCHYAASQSSFNQALPAKTVSQLSTALALLPVEPHDYGIQRDLSTALSSFQLAIRSAQLRKAGPAEIGGLVLASAWIAREIGDKDLERSYMQQALQFYLNAYENSNHYIANMSDVQAAYLIGEIYLRLDEYSQAVHWFNQVITHHNIKQHPAIEKLARDEWALAREESKNKSVNGSEAAEEKQNPENEHLNTGSQEKVTAEVRKPVQEKRRIGGQLMVNLYTDQTDWITQVMNLGYDNTHILVSKDQVVRAVLDAVMQTLDNDLPDSFHSEAELSAAIKARLRSGA